MKCRTCNLQALGGRAWCYACSVVLGKIKRRSDRRPDRAGGRPARVSKSPCVDCKGTCSAGALRCRKCAYKEQVARLGHPGCRTDREQSTEREARVEALCRRAALKLPLFD